MMTGIERLIAGGVLLSTAVTDAASVFFTAAVVARRRLHAANWSATWYLLLAFAVISYTQNAWYIVFAGLGSWLGAFITVGWLNRHDVRRHRVDGTAESTTKFMKG